MSIYSDLLNGFLPAAPAPTTKTRFLSDLLLLLVAMFVVGRPGSSSRERRIGRKGFKKWKGNRQSCHGCVLIPGRHG